MATLSILKAEHSHRLLVGYQHYGSLWLKKIFLIFFVLKNWKILHYLKVNYKFLVEVLWWSFMLSIHPKVKDFGNENETNY